MLLLYALLAWALLSIVVTFTAALGSDIDDVYMDRNPLPAHWIVRVVVFVQLPTILTLLIGTAGFKDLPEFFADHWRLWTTGYFVERDVE